MIEYTVTTDAHLMEQQFRKAAYVAPTMAAAITERNGKKLLEMVRALSPYKTGEYKDSHMIQLLGSGSLWSAEVYTDLDRGMMLEFGGNQVHSDGSTTYRDPHPHYRPAFEFVAAQYYEELARFITL